MYVNAMTYQKPLHFDPAPLYPNLVVHSTTGRQVNFGEGRDERDTHFWGRCFDLEGDG